MKKILLGLVGVMAFVTIAKAETVEITNRNQNVRLEVKSEARGQIEERIENKIENRLEKGQEWREKIAENHANRLERRFKFYYERMIMITERFQKRIDTLKEAGKDTANVQSKLDSTKTKLEEARKKGEEAVTAFRTIDPAKWNEQKTQIMAARDLAMNARKLYFEARELLKVALKELKTLFKPALPAASVAVDNSL